MSKWPKAGDVYELLEWPDHFGRSPFMVVVLLERVRTSECVWKCFRLDVGVSWTVEEAALTDASYKPTKL